MRRFEQQFGQEGSCVTTLDVDNPSLLHICEITRTI
jgi:hypothetical protein